MLNGEVRMIFIDNLSICCGSDVDGCKNYDGILESRRM